MEGPRFPRPENGTATPGDIWALLAHPVWGMGALHQKIGMVSDRIGQTEVRIGKIEEEAAAHLADFAEIRDRLIATDPDYARRIRDDIKRREDEAAAKAAHRSKIHELLLDRTVFMLFAAMAAGVSLLSGQALGIIHFIARLLSRVQ